jgi:uracil phosphoribosyltransferase
VTMPAPVRVSTHPLLLHKLARLRHKDTTPPVFRVMVREIAQVLFYEATADVPLRSVTVPTPLTDCPAHEIATKIGLVPVLRAGLGMADAMLDALPEASVWHIGLYRDHKTLQPVTYYNKLPATPTMDLALVLDPMLATGGSAIEAIRLLKAAGTQSVKFIGLIAAPEGVKALQSAHPDVPVYLAAIDEKLNDIGYIVPGLGDAGDRQFAT